MADEVDEQAPHGRDENGTPLAPYGYKANGDPRLSNRGRPPANAGPKVAAPQKKTSGGGKTAGAAKKSSGRTAKETRDQLLSIFDFVLTPIAVAGMNPKVREKIGEKQGDALAADAVILDAHAGDIVDGVMAYAEHKPGILAWMDRAEGLAPTIMLYQALGKVATALVKNHMNPDARLAAGARSMVNVKALQHARELQRIEAELLDAAEFEAQDIQRRQEALIAMGIPEDRVREQAAA